MTKKLRLSSVFVTGFAAIASACSGGGSDAGAGGASTGVSGSTTNNAAGMSTVGGASTSGGSGAGVPSVGGKPGTAGQSNQGDGGTMAASGAGAGSAGRPNVTAGAGGQAAAGSGGASAGSGGQAGSTGSDCTMTAAWPAADPAAAGPYPVTTEQNVGPMAGNPDPKYNNMVPQFNVYRPTTLGQGGVCHPIITWGNGHGDQPRTYEVLLKQLASHGFVVVASLSSIPSQGTPLPQIAGIDWMLKENADPASKYYHHLDTAHIGATGHSEGAGATAVAGGDARITAIVPIAGAGSNLKLHGPALFICGGKDTVALCSKITTTFDTIMNVPAMLAENLNADHGSWLSQGGIKGPTIIATTAWMRLHLMADMSLRSMFYGPSCKLCSDSANWTVLERKMMDQ